MTSTSTSTISSLDEMRSNAGRPKGTTNQAKLEATIRTNTAITKAAMKYADERSRAKSKGTNVGKGFLKNLLQETEEEFGLVAGTLIFSTIKARVERNNLTGFAPQRTSPLEMVEPIIVDYCVRLANMGAPLSREQVIALADSLICGTEHRQKLIEFKSK